MFGIRGRLFVSYATIIALVVCTVGAGLWGVLRLHEQGRVVAHETTPYLTNVASAAVSAKAAANDERGFLLTGDPTYSDEFNGRLSSIAEALAAADAAATTPQQSAAIADITSGFTAWSELVKAEFAMYPTDPETAKALALGANRDARKAYEAAISTATELANEALTASIAAQDSTAVLVQRLLFGLLAVAIAAAVAVAVWMARQVTVPLAELQRLLVQASEGDITGRATVRSRDEFGTVAVAFNTMLDSVSTVLSTIARAALGIASATEVLTESSVQISASANESSVQASAVATSAEQVSINIQTVASATEEMSASIREIATNTTDAADVAARAVQAAADASTTMATLGASSAEIGAVIKSISSIASQTNLLALNATIEAARAGEAGKGFAVVASEVKDLAQETSSATEDIVGRIDAIQADTRAAVEVIAQISTIIRRINDTQSTIASALEEQTATTNEMSRNVNEAAVGSSEIAYTVAGVAAAAALTTEGVARTLASGVELSAMSLELTEMVSRFTFASDVVGGRLGAGSRSA